MESTYLMIIAAALIFFFLIYQEIKRDNIHWLYLRLGAAFLAVAALLLLIIPLKYKAGNVSFTNQLLLVSKGAELKDLKEGAYFTTDSSVLKAYKNKGVQYIPDLAYYLQSNKEINNVKVYGYGLTTEELSRLKNYAYTLQPAPSPTGIISGSWPQVLKQTALLEVQGIYNNTTAKPVKLVLEGLGSRFDSVTIAAQTKTPFYFKSRPKQLGAAIYNLVAYNGTDVIEKEKIPFQVISASPIKILVLSSFPDFEYKFLKNWLYENKYPVVFRTRVSKDKFSQDLLNIKGVNAENLTTGMLSKFDLVIADDDELSKLNPAATGSVRAAVSQGLGILVRLNEAKPLSSFGSQFKLYSPADTTAKVITPVLAENVAPLKAIPSTEPLYITPKLDEQPLVKDKQGKVLLSSALQGNGKIAASVITSTYNWILTGSSTDYAEFWSYVIRLAARKEEAKINWKILPELPVVNEQAAVVFETELSDSVPVIAVNDHLLNPIQHKNVPFRWQSTFWPSKSGWNSVRINKNIPQRFFSYTANDWGSLKEQKLLNNNLAFEEKSVKQADNAQKASQFLEKEVSKWWFFALFLLASGFLWFETKML